MKPDTTQEKTMFILENAAKLLTMLLDCASIAIVIGHDPYPCTHHESCPGKHKVTVFGGGLSSVNDMQGFLKQAMDSLNKAGPVDPQVRGIPSPFGPQPPINI